MSSAGTVLQKADAWLSISSHFLSINEFFRTSVTSYEKKTAADNFPAKIFNDWKILTLLTTSVYQHTLKHTWNLNYVKIVKYVSKVGLKTKIAQTKIIRLNTNIMCECAIEVSCYTNQKSIATFFLNYGGAETSILSRIHKSSASVQHAQRNL